MKIIVTGGSGMVGNCIKNLIDDVHEFTFLSSKDCDLRNRYETMCYFQEGKFDYIIHLAANVGGLFKNMEKNIEMFSDNIKINENVLEACFTYNIQKGIFILSSCIYTPNPSKFPMDETMIHEGPPHPSNEGYAYAKRMMELQCRQYNNKYNTEYICLIPVNLYGEYDNFELGEAHVIPEIIYKFNNAKEWETNEYEVFGTGTPLRQFLYAKDFAKIILSILFEGKYNSTEPLICCNNEISIKKMIYKVCDIMEIDKDELIFNEDKADGCMKKTVSNKKFKKYFPDFKFTTLEEGLKNTYKWFLKNTNKRT